MMMMMMMMMADSEARFPIRVQYTVSGKMEPLVF